MSDRQTAREYGRAGKTPLFWMANEPFASEYRRGEAERVPAMIESLTPSPALAEINSIMASMEKRIMRGFREIDAPPSRAVPSLSGEFPGLGKWKLDDANITSKGMFLHISQPNAMYGLVAAFNSYSLTIYYSHTAAGHWKMQSILAWPELLSALPPREVVGDYVVGPHGVKFQVERVTAGYGSAAVDYLIIKGNGHSLLALDAEAIWLHAHGPLYKSMKHNDTTKWPLRGEG